MPAFFGTSLGMIVSKGATDIDGACDGEVGPHVEGGILANVHVDGASVDGLEDGATHLVQSKAPSMNRLQRLST